MFSFFVILFNLLSFNISAVISSQINSRNDLGLLQGIINQNQTVNLPKNTTFFISGELKIMDNQVIIGENTTIVQQKKNTPIFNCSYKQNIQIKGITFIGFGDDYLPTSSSSAVGVLCLGSTKLHLTNNTFHNFSYSPISGLSGTKQVYIEGNVMTAAPIHTNYYIKDRTGVTLGGQEIVIVNNSISGTSQGIIIAENSNNIKITNNVINDIPLEHGIYIDSQCSNLVISDNHITNVGGSGIKIQNRSTTLERCKNIKIERNTISKTKIGDGILIDNISQQKIYANNILISNNTIEDIGQDGINLRYTKNAKVYHNSINNVARSGFYLRMNYSLNITQNSVSNTDQNAIFDEGSGGHVTINDNQFLGIARKGIDHNGYSSGIFIQSAQNRTLSKNQIIGANHAMRYGIYLPLSKNNSLSIQENQISNFREYGIRFSGKQEEFKKLKKNQIIKGEALGAFLSLPY